MLLRYRKLIIVVLVLLAGAFAVEYYISSKPVDFTTEVKPIINKHCITCHGGVKQKGGFSLLFRDEALAKTKSGKIAIVPGDADNSEMIRRLTLTDPEERMPYKHEQLSNENIDVLRRWINEGAKWGQHWAYDPLKPVKIPEPRKFFGLLSAKSEWALNPVDNFIEEKLIDHDLRPSPGADRATLLRRVSLDIIGLPAPGHIAQKFLKGNSSNDYAELVDSLLASPHYGEKWAAMWMDLARYADTKGYEKDEARTIWKYRDWLIHAFNNDEPYDQFLTEQIAGDMLPNATDDDYIATAFQRNSMTNDEGGTDNEEFRTSAVIDRVNTTWDALLGTTFSCVQCHSHPYDPFRHEEYYKFLAFYNNTRDEDTQDDYPRLREFNDTMQQQMKNVVSWIAENTTEEKAKTVELFLKTWQPAVNSSLCDSFVNGVVGDPTWAVFRNNAVCRLKNINLDNKNSLIYKYAGPAPGGLWQIHLDKADGEIIASIPLAFTEDGGWGWRIEEANLKNASGVHDLYFTYTNPTIAGTDNTGAVIDWMHFTEKFPGEGKPGYQERKRDYWTLIRANVPSTPVMMENPADMRRQTHVFERGNWMVKAEKVEPATPLSLNAFPKDAPRNRIGLARWITSKENPLTARTMTNRIWEQLFGTGLAETLEDLGSQGIVPTHPELLNWLSYQFMNDYKWSIKTMIRTIVMSATYRQDSKITNELLQKDPDNKLYARSSRVRLSAEQIRDQALSVCGILSTKMYGPSVFPYQPKGLWLSPYNGTDWVQSRGEDQYRRAVYTFWKRSAPYPSMLTFDGVARNVCTSRRIRTNTPLQALTTLNDSAYIDMARHFALRMQESDGSDIRQQIAGGYKRCTYREIDEKSLNAFQQLYNVALEKFKKDPEKAHLMNGGSDKKSTAEFAAVVVVANAILNLDEVVTRN
ncbi:MAG: DUF1553 domain-containing protein [Chitinophagaceae bacterium]|nr:DUF1553 domain-containing protein [Chitinophagaceae bacterium]